MNEDINWWQILQLNTEFAWRIDHDGGSGVAELFAANGSYHIESARGRLELDGRERIEAFYEARRMRGHRISRHLFSNLRLASLTSESAVGIIVLQLYAADGTATSSAAPVLIADFHDQYVRHDGTWKFKSRLAQVVFGTIPDLASPGAVPAPNPSHS